MEALPQDLADFLVTKNFDPEYFDDQGQPAEAGDAKTIKFDYIASTGKNYGTAVCVIADDELSFFYGDNLGRGMEPEDKEEWFSFLEELSNKAASHSSVWSPRDINQLKHTLAGIAAIKEGLFEGYYGNRRVSYMGEQTQARLVINHNRVLGEEDKRYRYVESLFIETADQERFRLPFKSLSAGRAMLEHVRSGGKPYDIRGNHITEIVSEMAVLSRFNRAQHNRVFEGITQELVESARQYYQNLQETIKHLGSTRGYQAYFENWAPDQVGEAESLVENLRNLFVEQTLDARIEAALPTLAKIQQQGNNMKEAQIFENWINNLSEGTWALPETPDQQEKLNQLMSAELIVGPDATNATELLYDIVGDDELFDILHDLAEKSEGRANIWDDSDVQARLAELGVQTPQSTAAEPADVPQDTAPAMKENAGQLSVQQLATISDAALDAAYGYGRSAPGNTFGWQANLKSAAYAKQMIDQGITDIEAISDAIHKGWNTTAQAFVQDPEQFDDRKNETLKLQKKSPDKSPEEIAQEVNALIEKKRAQRAQLMKQNYGQLPEEEKEKDRVVARALLQAIRGEQGVAEGDNMATFTESNELARMLKHAGVPVSEGVLNDDTGNTWDHLLDRFKHEVENFRQTGDLDDDLYDALYDYYHHHGAMPYGVAKARTGDPYEWIGDRFANDIGLDEGWKGALAGGLAGAGLGSVVPALGTIAGGIAGAYAGHKIGDQGLSDPDKEWKSPEPKKPVSECNYTMEGEYCPEHGLAECGTPAEGGAVGMPYSMHEGTNDPINYNAAMTGAYYEGKETRTQEGDALLARIKSLALLR
jgi:hypothetical protein